MKKAIAILIDDGGRLVNVVEAPDDINAIMLPVFDRDEKSIAEIVPEHRPRLSTMRRFVFGAELKNPYCGSKVRVFRLDPHARF